MNPDITIELTFTLATSQATIRTNAKHELVANLLGEYLQSIMGAGQGKDATPPEQRDVYTITLGIELADDAWGSSHNCGNRGLRDGLILRIYQLMSEDPAKITYL